MALEVSQSSFALDWIAEQGIALVRINYDGGSTIAFSPNGYAADPKLVAWQRETRDDPKLQLAFAIQTTRQKLEAALETLREFIPSTDNQLAAKIDWRIAKAKARVAVAIARY